MHTEMIGTGNTIAGQLPERKSGKRTSPRAASAAAKQPVSRNPTARLEKSENIGKIGKTVADIERISLAFNKKLKFEVDHTDHDVTIKVIDPETDKVIKELPPKELERLRDQIRDALGVLFDVQI
jgi:flagellar protein FlaG